MPTMSDPNVYMLAALGLTNEEAIARVVDRLCDRLLHSVSSDDEGREYPRESEFSQKLREHAKRAIDLKVNQLADQHVLPKVSAMVENLTLQETNRWGEKTGKALTFIEYLVQRAEHYLTEKVDFEGKSEAEKRAAGYASSWSGAQTRVAHMVHQHLHYSIETAMKQAIGAANSAIVKGLEETVKIKIAEIAAALKVSVKV